eukprot:gene4215-4464_t
MHTEVQIIFVGGSETALSCIEQLLLHPQLTFTNLTMLAPGGVTVGGVACEYTAALVARMGLEATVTLVDGHMTQLDRHQKLVGLADGSQLPYDVLVVATGQQDHLAAAVNGAFPEASSFVVSSDQLAKGSVSPAAVSGLTSILLYTSQAGLAAYDVVAALQEAGVPASAITWVDADPAQHDQLLLLLLALAAHLQLELPTPQQGQLLQLLPTADGSQATATLQGSASGPEQQLHVDLLVASGCPGPSAAVAKCLSGAKLVWDGCLVVDANFASNDQAVMGAGSVAKFSRRYTLPAVLQHHYNSVQVGAALAASIVESVAAPLASSEHSNEEHVAMWQNRGHSSATRELPALQQGKVVGCRLPGGHVFAFAGCPAAMAAPALACPPGGRSIISFSTAPEPGVYVLSEHDLLAKLSEPWADLLFNDAFRTLRTQLVQHCLTCSRACGGKGVACAEASAAGADDRIIPKGDACVSVSPACVQDAVAELMMVHGNAGSQLPPYMMKLASVDA